MVSRPCFRAFMLALGIALIPLGVVVAVAVSPPAPSDHGVTPRAARTPVRDLTPEQRSADPDPTTDAEGERRRRVERRRARPPVEGKGMWIYQMERVRRGDPARIARSAARLELSHLYVRVGSGWGSLRTLDQARRLLPAAHRAGLKVIAWYFPYFLDIQREVAEGRTAMRARYKGHRFDGFAVDIERAPGSRFNASRITRYSRKLQRVAGRTPLISVVPWPSSYQRASFPYAASIVGYDVVAPMAYWGSYHPRVVAAESMRVLKRFGVPIAPIGQAYDMGPEGGPRGVPRARAVKAFMSEVKRRGAIGVSFWSWQHARSRQLLAIGGFPWRVARSRGR